MALAVPLYCKEGATLSLTLFVLPDLLAFILSHSFSRYCIMYFRLELFDICTADVQILDSVVKYAPVSLQMSVGYLCENWLTRALSVYPCFS